jgi:hypothetical protein
VEGNGQWGFIDTDDTVGSQLLGLQAVTMIGTVDTHKLSPTRFVVPLFTSMEVIGLTV